MNVSLTAQERTALDGDGYVVLAGAFNAIVFPQALVHSGTRNRSTASRDSIQAAYRPVRTVGRRGSQ